MDDLIDWSEILPDDISSDDGAEAIPTFGFQFKFGATERQAAQYHDAQVWDGRITSPFYVEFCTRRTPAHHMVAARAALWPTLTFVYDFNSLSDETDIAGYVTFKDGVSGVLHNGPQPGKMKRWRWGGITNSTDDPALREVIVFQQFVPPGLYVGRPFVDWFDRVIAMIPEPYRDVAMLVVDDREDGANVSVRYVGPKLGP